MGNMKQWMDSLRSLISTKSYETYLVDIGEVKCSLYRIESGAFDILFPITLDFWNELEYLHFLICLEKYHQYPVKSILFSLNYASDIYIHIISQINALTKYSITLVTMKPGKSLDKFMELQRTISNLHSIFLNFQLPVSMSMVKGILRQNDNIGTIVDWITDDEMGVDYDELGNLLIPQHEQQGQHRRYSPNLIETHPNFKEKYA
jgi:hypothetical protein